MRKHLLLRSLVLAGAAFTLVAAGGAASVTLLSDRAPVLSVGGDSTGTRNIVSAGGASAPESRVAGDGRVSEPASVKSAGPSVFEQQARSQQYPQPISVGPSIFEQQARSQMPSPAPPPFTRGPGF
jgi:hypothetical protein